MMRHTPPRPIFKLRISYVRVYRIYTAVYSRMPGQLTSGQQRTRIVDIVDDDQTHTVYDTARAIEILPASATTFTNLIMQSSIARCPICVLRAMRELEVQSAVTKPCSYTYLSILN